MFDRNFENVIEGHISLEGPTSNKTTDQLSSNPRIMSFTLKSNSFAIAGIFVHILPKHLRLPQILGASQQKCRNVKKKNPLLIQTSFSFFQRLVVVTHCCGASPQVFCPVYGTYYTVHLFTVYHTCGPCGRRPVRLHGNLIPATHFLTEVPCQWELISNQGISIPNNLPSTSFVHVHGCLLRIHGPPSTHRLLNLFFFRFLFFFLVFLLYFWFSQIIPQNDIRKPYRPLQFEKFGGSVFIKTQISLNTIVLSAQISIYPFPHKFWASQNVVIQYQ